uniref:Immunoglobulin heavy constant zeta n=1 Tax=Cyprinus carpio TaxID=7962 RepID=A0A8C1KYD2_CYPCA
MRISKSDWNHTKPYKCEASNPNGKKVSLVAPRSPRDPTLSLVPVITLKSKSVMCIIEDFYPKNNLSVQWKINNTNSMSQLKLESKLNNQGYYNGYSFYEVSSDNWDVDTQYTCEVTHQGKQFNSKANFKAKLSLTVESPIQKELFVYDKIVLQAVVSGDVKVQDTSVSCKVKDESVPTENITTGNVEFSTDTSQFKRIHNVTVDTKKWFDGEMVTCTIRDPNNKDIKREISFQKGDGNKPTVTIYKPDNVTDHISHVCEVTSPKLGDVYVIWKVGDEPYIEGGTSAPIHQKDSTSVFSILTMTKEEYEKLSTTITCAVIHANMDNRRAPLQVSTSQNEPPEPETGFALDCNKDVLEEDEFRSLWSTATSFIFLFLFSLTYSAVLSFFKVKQ